MKFDKLKHRWKRNRIRRREASALRRKLLRERARPLFEKYGISKVVLFGSASENRSLPDSDIDLFVSPLPADNYWNFIRELGDTVDLPVDVYTDTDGEVFVKKILERGEVVHEL